MVIVLKLNNGGKGFKDAGNNYYEEKYALVHEQNGCKKKGTSGAHLLLDLWLIIKYHEISGSLLVLYRELKKIR